MKLFKKGWFDFVGYKLKDMYIQVTSLASEYDNINILC